MMKCTIIPEDINQKISESIFRYRGVPYYFKSAGGKKLYYYALDNINGDAVGVIPFNDDNFDFSSIPLGYVNLKPYEVCVYLVRTPVRKVKQGINGGNVKGAVLPGTMKGYGGINTVLYSKAFIEAAMGRYPGLEEAVSKLRKINKEGQIAVSRDIALSIDEQDIIKVYYKQQYVGWMQPNKFTVHVKNNELGWVVSKYLSHLLGWQID